MKIKAFIVGCLLSLSAFAGDLTVTWASANDPVGWNLYFNHLQTPDAFQYVGSYAGSERSASFHNVSTSGVYQIGITRVEYVVVGGVNRRVEGPMEIMTFQDGQFISNPPGLAFTSSSYTP